MKLVYIASTAAIIYTIKFQEPIKSTYEKGQDAFLHWQLLWTFSILLECLTIMPQLVVLQRYREVENLTGNYVFFMGAYRALYILNWIYRANTEAHYKHHWVVYICGVIQTLLYADFFYYYLKSKAKGGKFSLPTSRA